MSKEGRLLVLALVCALEEPDHTTEDDDEEGSLIVDQDLARQLGFTEQEIALFPPSAGFNKNLN